MVDFVNATAGIPNLFQYFRNNAYLRQNPNRNLPLFWKTTTSGQGDREEQETKFDRDRYESALQNVRGWNAGAIRTLADAFFQDARTQLQADRDAGRDFIDDQRRTALAQMQESNDALREQSNRILQSPAEAMITIPTQSPITPVNQLETDPALAGTNAAIEGFYIPPESTQSQFTVGAPVGGGIPNRTRGSTRDITSEPQSFSGSKKDQL